MCYAKTFSFCKYINDGEQPFFQCKIFIDWIETLSTFNYRYYTISKKFSFQSWQSLHCHSLVQECLKFFLMCCLGSSGWRGSCLPTNVFQESVRHNVLLYNPSIILWWPVISSNSCLCPRLYIWPGPHVLVLLLHPAQLGIAVLLSHLVIEDHVMNYLTIHTCFIISNGKGQICSIVWMAIWSSSPLSLLSFSRS